MSFLFYFSVWALASTFAAACAIGSKEKKKGEGVPALRKEEKDPDGEKVRAIIFEAYKEMKKHTPALDLLTACLTRSRVSKDTAFFALSKTLERLDGRYNTKPVESAINNLKSL